MRTFHLPVLVVAIALAVSTPADARRSIGSGTSGYEQINKGVVDLGFFDSLFLLRYLNDSSRQSSSMVVAFIGGFTPRYFVIDNLAIGLSFNLMAQKEWVVAGSDQIDSSDLGFLGLVTANYYIRLGHSAFWKPGIGGGGFVGSRDIPGVDPGTEIESSLYGGAVRIDLGFAVYLSKFVNLRAGPDLLMRFGVDQPVDAEGSSFVELDAGLAVGFGYSF